jgi:endoglucanase Acf2
MRRILSLYGLSINIKRPRRVKAEWYLNISNLAQQDFKNFKKVYNANKVITNHVQSYDDWYDTCNLDGTFAYNGVANDF